MAETNQEPVVIIGAGLVGSMAAILMGRRGCRVQLYEGRQDPRRSSQQDVNGLHGMLCNTTKRSINLALSHRGLCALRKIGMEGKVMEQAIAMEGRMIHPPGEADKNKSVLQPYDHRPGHAIFSISREDLNFALLEEIEGMPNVSVEFEKKFESFDSSANVVNVTGKEGDRSSVKARCVIGADGAFSKVREALARVERMNFSREYITTGYKELTIPPTPAGDFAMHARALHIWPREEFMLIALPNADKSFTATLFISFEEIEKIKTPEQLKSFFQEWFPDVAADNFALMPTLVEDFFGNPMSPLLSITCDPWHHKDKLLLLGDAAHACLPFYGQGMNAGFEDALRLDELLEERGGDFLATFADLSKELVPSRRGLVQASIQNHKEMQSKTNSKLFIMKKKVDWLLEDIFPGKWIPLYTMVTFTRIPYHEALRRASVQDRILAAAFASLTVLGGILACSSAMRGFRR